MASATVLLAKLVPDAKTFVQKAHGVLAACNNASAVQMVAVTPLQEAVPVVSGSLGQHAVVPAQTVELILITDNDAFLRYVGTVLQKHMPLPMEKH